MNAKTGNFEISRLGFDLNYYFDSAYKARINMRHSCHLYSLETGYWFDLAKDSIECEEIPGISIPDIILKIMFDRFKNS